MLGGGGGGCGGGGGYGVEVSALRSIIIRYFSLLLGLMIE